MLLILKSSFKESVARSHPWTPVKMQTMEQSNFWSPPHQAPGGAADPWAASTACEDASAHLPVHCWRASHTWWSGALPREKWARQLGIMKICRAENVPGKGFFKLWKNPPHHQKMAFSVWNTHGMERMLGDKYSWVFLLKTLKYSYICTKVLLACNVLCSTVISQAP